ncbi:MAG: globin [Mariprofundaceae bacterium]|nr:globin [Mariprofundaceae bacterium]
MSIQKKAKRVHQSYIRSGSQKLIAAFYTRLMDADEEIRKKFETVDMTEQASLLSHAIVMSFLFVDKNQQVAKKCIDNVRKTHAQHNLNIAPELYDTWLECLLETVALCDPHANDELLNDWRHVMSVAINHIREGY